MSRYRYNNQVIPPAPFAYTSQGAGHSGALSMEYPAQLDTAADLSVIPFRIVDDVKLDQFGEFEAIGLGGHLMTYPHSWFGSNSGVYLPRSSRSWPVLTNPTSCLFATFSIDSGLRSTDQTWFSRSSDAGTGTSRRRVAHAGGSGLHAADVR